jgi:hypothetical protein
VLLLVEHALLAVLALTYLDELGAIRSLGNTCSVVWRHQMRIPLVVNAAQVLRTCRVVPKVQILVLDLLLGRRLVASGGCLRLLNSQGVGI